MRSVAANKFDLNSASLVQVASRITEPYKRREIVYRVTHASEPIADVLPNDRRQTLVPSTDDPRTGTLTVKTAGPLVGEEGPETVDPAYLAPNALITSKDSDVASLARRAVGDQKDPWRKATAIQLWVFQNIRKKNFETAFAAASEVARDLEGDCTEHAVLTAAMCRSQGIPARVVVGLLYDEPHSGFGFHMWNEVYVNRRWVALDSAWDQTDVDAVHIKLSDSSLEGVAPYETFLSVVRVLNKLQVEPIEIR
ncbi:MAG: transglutaminase-like domain-containing protein [Isosphaeraceae bacterium]|nr:transglutaminase-like domain-containing protein [Isosphaeraceae bacterium]